ncbi:response regulator transcription factor [Caulobacter segnis]|uniref:response regulator transcription factor n=1 Tax=Caulobacter segnis TaxID=88688 RepID=UPI00286528AD|nr:response regulator transcription factor [Caulobacter segnis]MDR6627923.1 two-component system KDP operon response regulator KdpE [Caulobacter segnis]
MPRLVLIEDEPAIIRSLSPALSAENWSVSGCERGAEGLRLIAQEGCDVVLLDLGLPDMDGKEVIARLREWSEVPIIVLSARHQETEKIAALDLGADDFVNKPFAVGELMARLRAVMRGRERRFLSQSSFNLGPLSIDFLTRTVRIEDQEIHLTKREYDLVRTLALHVGLIVTHRQLADSVWGPGMNVEQQAIRVLVAQTRQKLEHDPSRPRLILTEQGLGYRLRDPSD